MRSRRIFPTFAFLLFLLKATLTFKRLRSRAPAAAANWRCHFAKFTSRLQIEPKIPEYVRQQQKFGLLLLFVKS